MFCYTSTEEGMGGGGGGRGVVGGGVWSQVTKI